MQKVCGRCRATFSCQQAGGCWCGDLQLEPARLAWLKARYDDCLCPACLTAVAAGGRNPELPHAT